MTEVERLLAIEEIKQTKARYFYGLDHRDWDLWRSSVWAPDGRLEVPEADMVVAPLDKIIEWVGEVSDRAERVGSRLQILTAR